MAKMNSDVRKVYEILTTEGPQTFASKAMSALHARAASFYWDLRGRRTITVDRTTATFNSKGRSSYSLKFFLRSEAILVEDMLAEAHSNDVLWDVGANIGFHSAFVGQHVDSTVAFEPVPATADELADNLHRNDIEAIVRPHALSDANGELTLTDEVSPRIDAEEPIVRPAHTGNSLIRNTETPLPTMLKVDVEGAEGDVLTGMTGALENCRVIYVEVHRPRGESLSVADFGYSVNDIFEILRESGFSVERLTNRKQELHLKALKKN